MDALGLAVATMTSPLLLVRSRAVVSWWVRDGEQWRSLDL